MSEEKNEEKHKLGELIWEAIKFLGEIVELVFEHFTKKH